MVGGICSARFEIIYSVRKIRSIRCILVVLYVVVVGNVYFSRQKVG